MPAPKSPPIRVAIVEDDAPTRRILERFLRASAQFEPTAAFPDAESALAGFEKGFLHPPEVVLTDINLPGASGIEFVRQAKALSLHTQFLMLTVYEDTEHIYAALKAGATGYLLKGASHDELAAGIREIHRGGSPMSGYIARQVIRSFQPSVAEPADEPLSAREHEVLQHLANGLLYKEIADALQISLPTVATHIRHIYEKLHVRSRTQAVTRFLGR